MAGELKGAAPTSATCKFLAFNAANQVWNTTGTPAFENWNDGNYADYLLTATQEGTSGWFTGNSPSTSAVYYWLRQIVGSTPSTDFTVWEDILSLPLAQPGQSGGLPLATSNGYSGTAQGNGAGANTIQLASSASSLQNYVGQQIVVYGSVAGIEVNIVSSYNPTTKVAACLNNWLNTISNTTPYAFPGLLQPSLAIVVEQIVPVQ